MNSPQRLVKQARRAVIFVAVFVLLAGAWLRPLDGASVTVIDAGFQRALVSFATARALNAAISVAQGTEVAVEPGGVGVNFAPGQVLDPFNDVVERFSNLMLAASVAFGIQKVLVKIGGCWAVSLALSVVALCWLALETARGPAPAWLYRGLVLLAMLRFAVPVVTVGSDGLFQSFLADDYTISQKAIEGASGDVQALAPPLSSAQQNEGLLERMKGWWGRNLDVNARFEQLRTLAEQWTNHIITLIVVFVLQTLLLPLLLLWVLLSLARIALRGLRQAG